MTDLLIRFGIALTVAAVVFLALRTDPAPANTETLTCVRVKEVTPAGTINYLCEVRK